MFLEAKHFGFWVFALLNLLSAPTFVPQLTFAYVDYIYWYVP